MMPTSSPAPKQQQQHSAADDVESAPAPTPVKSAAQLGVFMGVFIPCIQNIFGVLFFIRMTWIIGTAGVLQSFFIVLTCASVTFTTAISLSAIATNGVVSGGGPYYMISRNLGPELGGAVGILFYLGTSIAASMYICGAAEILINYMAPSTKIFDEFNCYRIYGSCLLVVLGLIVFAGVRVVGKFALPMVIVVLFCIGSVLVGAFIQYDGSDSVQFCMVGERPVALSDWVAKHPDQRSPNCTSEDLEQLFCLNIDGNYTCDPYFEAKRKIKVGKNGGPAIRWERAIRGIASGAFFDNFWPKYRAQGDLISKSPADKLRIERAGPTGEFWIYSQTTTSFIILVGVFFPSVTGIMAGSNRSGNLRDASRAIPLGTLAAQMSTSFVYLSGVLVFGATFAEMFMRDKFGKSAFGILAIAQLAIPEPFVIVVGCFLASLGAGMQSLTGAPRLLQAIAQDDVIPFLKPFCVSDSRGEPIRAILITLFITWCGILIAVIENIAALITQFFLMCYLGVNTACALQSLLRAPGWRPGFRYFHWCTSLFGAVLCVVVMFISAWYFALIAITVGILVYKYIEWVGAEKEWGDGIRGLGLSAARFALLQLENKQEHSRNWRPQLLVIADKPTGPDIETLMSFCGQLKAGKGLTIITHCMEGDYIRDAQLAENRLEELEQLAKQHRIKGFCDTLVANDRQEGVSSLIQTSGLGGLRHNTVVLSWPADWETDATHKTSRQFVSTIRTASAAKCAILVVKNKEEWPSAHRESGWLDVWWVVHDGGLLMLLPFLLRQHKTWRHTRLRLFAIAQIEDNNVQMKTDLERFLYHLRIEAIIQVIEISHSDISDYAYERTVKIDNRMRLLSAIHGGQDARLNLDLQIAIDEATRERKMSRIHDEDIARVVGDGSGGGGGGGNGGLSDSQIKAGSLPPVVEEATPQNTLTSVGGGDRSPRGVRFSEDDNDRLTANKSTTPNASRQSPRSQHAVHKMHTALKLNELIKKNSIDAPLVVVNMPAPPEHEGDQYFMEFVEALTEGITRVLLVRGTGAEVITMYS